MKGELAEAQRVGKVVKVRLLKELIAELEGERGKKNLPISAEGG